MKQLAISFDAGLLERFPEFSDCLKASVYSGRKQLKSIAADMDMSSSELSRKLADNPADPVYFPAKRLPDLLAATGDLSPIYWLIERFLESDELKKSRAKAELAAMMPKIMALLEAA